ARAFAARRDGRTLRAVQAPSQDARDGRLTRPAMSREDVAVRNSPLRDGVLERSLDVFLVDHVGKRLRPVFTRDDLIHGGMLRRAGSNARPRVIRGTRTAPLPLLP